MTLPDQHPLYDELKERYGVGLRYSQAYLALWLKGRALSELPATLTLKEILSAPPPAPMWFDYAMSTNWRGGVIADLLAPRLPSQAKRYLDVGSGFGGFLVAFAKRGLEVHGIEIDTQRIELAQANCQDFNLGDCVTANSILEPDLPARLGTFDVITCIDVIEHVLDVPLAIANMTALLNPGGILFLEIPNKDSLSFVARDGHFELFGITLLPRSAAIEYHKAFFNFAYDVGDYFPLDFYRAEFAKHGCRVETLAPDLPARTLAEGWGKVKEGQQRYQTELRPKLTPALDSQLMNCIKRYRQGYAWDRLRARLTLRWRQAFYQKYLVDFWRVVVTKS
jgi:SAM-dependent methyltransferase